MDSKLAERFRSFRRLDATASAAVAAVLVSLLVGCSQGEGNTTQAPAVFGWPILTSPGRPGSLGFTAIEDLNGDGHLDIRGSNPVGDLTVRLLGVGGARFTPDTPLGGIPGLPPGAEQGAVVAAFDLPGDDLPDLVVTWSGGWVLLSSAGPGGYAARELTEFAQPGAFVTAAVGVDLDGDGDRDLVTISSPSGAIEAWHVTGMGLAPTALAISPLLSSRLVSGDVDGDGHQDVVVVSGFIPHSVWIGDGLGGLTAWGRLPNVVGTLADWDGDGDLDLLSVTPSTLAWWRNDGTSAFSGPMFLAPHPSAVSSIATLAVGDVDGNGTRDLVEGDPARLWLQRTDGTLDRIDLPIAGGQAFVADVTEDALLDLVFVGDSTSVLPQNPDHTFTVPSGIDFGGTIRRVLSAPLQLGGPRRLVVQAGNATLANGPDSLRIADVVSGNVVELSVAYAPTSAWNFVALTDLDGDGAEDVVIYQGAGLQVLRGDGAGGFLAPIALSTLVVAGPVGFGDLDGDGDADVYDPTLARISSNQSFAFSYALGPNGFAGPYAAFEPCVIRDFDGDGRADIGILAGRGSSPGLIAYGLGGSPPSFTDLVAIGPLVGLDAVTNWIETDVDADGRVDWVDVNHGLWLANDGTGRAVGAPHALAAPFAGLDGQVADLDGDGRRNDVLVRHEDGFDAWIQTGPAIFTRGQPRPARAGPSNLQTLVIADADGDDRDDLLAWEGSRLHFLANSGTAPRAR